MLFPIIVTVLVGLTILLLANFAKKVNTEGTDQAPQAIESTPSIHDEIAKRAEEAKTRVPIEAPTTAAKPKAKKKSAPKKKTTIKVNA